MVERDLPWPSVSIEHHAFDIDGVAVHHFPTTDAITAATLTFGVGLRDESLPTLGSLHALEHLVMDAVRRTPIDVNGEVSAGLTEFTAKGSPALVGEFLAGVCQALSAPPLDRLSTEIAVLEAEGGFDQGADALVVARYGWRDLALVGAPGPGPRGVRPGVLRDLARHWFVAANALLVVEGPLPEGLRLDLPTGGAPRREPVAPNRWGHHRAVMVESARCGVSLLFPAEGPEPVNLIAFNVIENRISEVLRHERGLTYDVDVSAARTADDQWDVSVSIEPPEERLAEATKLFIEQIRLLLSTEPSVEEVVAARAEFIESLRGRDGEMWSVLRIALSGLRGDRLPPINPQAVDAVDPSAVANLLRTVAPEALFLIDETLRQEVESLGIPCAGPEPVTDGPLPVGELFRAPLLARALSTEARAAGVVLLADGLAARDGQSHKRIRWPEIVGILEIEDDVQDVFGQAGQIISIGQGLFARGQRLTEAVRSHVAPELWFRAPAPADGSGAGSSG